MNAAVSSALWVVGKALTPVVDGFLEDWAASKNLCSNIKDLKLELLSVKATLEIAQGKQLDGQAQQELLQKLRDSAYKAEDLLDELDYFRIQDKLCGTYEAADEHAKGSVHNLVFHAHQTAKAVGNRLAPSSAASIGDAGEDASQGAFCCAWPRARQKASNGSSSTTNTNQAGDKGSGCMHNLGKIFLCSSSPSVQGDGVDSGKSILNGGEMHKAPEKKHAEKTPKLGFKRVDVSSSMKDIVEQLQTIHKKVTTVVRSCSPRTTTKIARPTTISESVEPKLYGREEQVRDIIHNITKGKYREENLTVLPIVGSGGIGKTTMTQHIYHIPEVQKHFDVCIWVCVSLKFDLNKVLEEIKKSIPEVEGEKREGSAKELIEQRLKSKRYLLILDDMWECANEDDWKRLLLPLKKSQKKGSMILVTTRFPSLAKMVQTTDKPIELEGLKTEKFRELFLSFVFGEDDQRRKDHKQLLNTGEKIMKKLKGSPLAAKTVGRLLRTHLDLHHWNKVLQSKEWEMQSGDYDIMPALKLSYDHLPFQPQQCFFYCALFPEDYRFDSEELIHFWIGLDILYASGPSKTVEDIALSSLNELVTHGFLKKEETDGNQYYIIHDLLHDLALKVASHECLSLHGSNVRSVEIQPCIRHLSIIIDGVDCEHFKSELRKLKDKLKVEDLQTLMVFGEIDESFAKIFADLFREANAFRVLRLSTTPYPVESIIHKFSALLHLRYLCLGPMPEGQMHLPMPEGQMHLLNTISRFYHLRILDLEAWDDSDDLPEDMNNLEKLCHFVTYRAMLHSCICNVGKLKLLQELKAFKVKKESEGFGLEQLEHLTDLRELGIYNLEKIHTKEEAAKAKLIDKNYLQRLTLDWDSERPSAEPDVETAVLESLQPHADLVALSITGHRGRSCPTWLGDVLAVEALESLHLASVSWEVLPSLDRMCDLGYLRLERIDSLKEFCLEQSYCKLTRLQLHGLESLDQWVSRKTISFPLLRKLSIKNCPILVNLPFSDQQDYNIAQFPMLQELFITKCPKVSSLPPVPWTQTLDRVRIGSVGSKS